MNSTKNDWYQKVEKQEIKEREDSSCEKTGPEIEIFRIYTVNLNMNIVHQTQLFEIYII